MQHHSWAVQMSMSACAPGASTHHRHHEEEEGEGRQPEVPEGAVLHLAAALGSGLEGDHAAEELGSDCPPAGLHHAQHRVRRARPHTRLG